MAEASRDDLTGSRIRERRLAAQMAQGALARAVGISPSYLNLIEHNHRKIGGALVVSIARALDVAPAILTEGAAAGLGAVMRAAEQATGPTKPETERLDELAARFPGWTALIAEQDQRNQQLEAEIVALRDRLAHDTDLSEAMHEVLSSVAAIRSTADILAQEPDLDAAWRGRFHRNLHDEAERLSTRATGLLGQFELPDGSGAGAGAGAARPAVEAAEAMFDLADHHFPDIEREGAEAIEALVAGSVALDSEVARDVARRWLRAYAEDAARLPLPVFKAAAEDAGHDPAALMALAGGDAALVFRRLATLPSVPDLPPFGLAVADASGAILFRRRTPDFALPRYGAGCPRWPLYRAFARPGQPDVALLDVPGRGRLRAWSVAQVALGAGPVDLSTAPPLRATMLVQAAPAADGDAIEVGPACPDCRATPHIQRG